MKKNASFLYRLSGFFLCLSVLSAAVSCRSHDPMDPYRDLGAPRGMKDTYPDVRKKKESGKKSFFQNFFQEEQEKKRRFRDVSRPMPQGTVEVFPWRGDSRRSEGLRDEIRREKRNMD